MKKLTAILLIVLYSGLNVVNAINLHYCHGNLVDYSINKPVDSCCGSDLEAEFNCCSSVSIDIELDKNQLVQPSLKLDMLKAVSVLNHIQNNSRFSEISLLYKSFNISDSPPGESSNEIFLLNNSFLFYG